MIWKQNLLAIKRRDPSLADKLAAVSPMPGVEVITAQNGRLVPVWDDRPLYSRYDPSREAEAWAANILPEQMQSGRVYLVFGLGLGYHLDALLQKDPYAHFLVFETDLAWWRSLLELRDVRHLIKHKRVFLQTTPDLPLGSPAFNLIHRSVFTGTVILGELPAYRDLFSTAYQQWLAQTKECLHHIRTGLATREHWKDVWLANSIANLADVFAHPGVVEVRDCLADTPAVMAASGPSLNEHMETLRQLVGRVPIIAAGSGLVPLRQNGIDPDYVVSIDPGEGNYASLKGYLDAPNTTLVFTSSLHPPVLREFTGPKIAAFADQEYLPRWIGEAVGWDKGTLPDATSVAIPTLDFVIGLGCPEIVLLGQDFSFAVPEKYYAGQMPSEAGNDYFSCTNLAGATVYTTKQLVSMRRELELYVEKANRAGRTVYNASGTGLAIRGTSPVDFAVWAQAQQHRRFKQPSLDLKPLEPAEVLNQLKEPIHNIRQELLALRDLVADAALILKPLCPPNRLDRKKAVPILSRAVSQLNQARETESFRKVIRRTVSNLEILVTTRQLNMDKASDEQIQAFISLLNNFATAVGGRAERYYSELTKL